MKKHFYLYILMATMWGPLESQPDSALRYDRNGALGYSIHGGYRKLPRVGYVRCNYVNDSV